MAVTRWGFSAELPAGRRLLSGAGMLFMGRTPPGCSSDQGEKFVLMAALRSRCYPGDENVWLYPPRRDLSCSQPNFLSVLKFFSDLHLNIEDIVEGERE